MTAIRYLSVCSGIEAANTEELGFATPPVWSKD